MWASLFRGIWKLLGLAYFHKQFIISCATDDIIHFCRIIGKNLMKVHRPPPGLITRTTLINASQFFTNFLNFVDLQCSWLWWGWKASKSRNQSVHLLVKVCLSTVLLPDTYCLITYCMECCVQCFTLACSPKHLLNWFFSWSIDNHSADHTKHFWRYEVSHRAFCEYGRSFLHTLFNWTIWNT